MIDTKALRNRILDLAIQGKLTEQLESDGTAEELYQQIQAEKQALIKEGKIKKEKPLPEIAADEIPFEIPQNWMWVRLGDISNAVTGRLDANQQVPDGQYPFFTCGQEVYKIDEYAFDCDAILLGGNNASGDYKMHRYNGKFNAYQRVYVITLPPHDTLDYLFYVIGYWLPLLKFNSQGAMTRFIRIGQVHNMLIPLPPLAEQKRIVERVEEIFRLLDTIDKAQEKYSADSQILKAKLITAGIQGKLTKQLESDGTAYELYQQIQEEKQKLIKEGKLKKEKPLPHISPNEIPFEIPQNWMWVRLGDVFTLQAGKFISASQISDNQDSENQYKCFGGNGVRGYVKDYNTTGTHALIGRQGALCGNVNLAHDIFYATEHAVVVYQYCDTDVNWIFYGLTELNLNQYATSVAQPGLAVGKIEKVLIPLPPLAEQKRIAVVMERVLGEIDNK